MDARPRQEPVDLELRDYLRVLRRQWVLILLIVVLVTALGLANSLRKPTVYDATAQVLLDTGFSRTVLYANSTSLPDIGDQVTTETDLMKTTVVTDAVAEDVGYEPDVSISAVEPSDEDAETRSIGVTGHAATPAEAVKAADDFARSFVTVRAGLIEEDLQAEIEQNQTSLTNLDTSTARTQETIRQLDAQIAAASGETRDVLEARRDRLTRSVLPGQVDERQAAIQARLDLLGGALANNRSRGIFKVNDADVPASPVSPRPLKEGGISLLIGLGLGIAAAFLRDYYDDSLRTKDDLDRVTSGRTVLGIIPSIKSWRDESDAELESLVHPTSAASEAYRSLRTSLEFQGVGKEMRLIHITSSTSGEGKSATSANLAVSLARAGHDVVLVDCDLRRPRVHQFFDLPNTTGFTTVLLGTTTIDQALQRVPDVPGLFVLPCGPQPPNPSELLASDIAQTRLRLLAKTADYVIIDSPPLLPVTDSVILASHADATLLVVRARSTNRRSINRALELLDQVNAPLVGLVLNRVRQEATYGYGYGYGTAESKLGTDLVARARKVGAGSATTGTPSPGTNGSDASNGSTPPSFPAEVSDAPASDTISGAPVAPVDGSPPEPPVTPADSTPPPVPETGATPAGAGDHGDHEHDEVGETTTTNASTDGSNRIGRSRSWPRGTS